MNCVLPLWRSSDHIPLVYFSNILVSEKRPKYIMSESRIVSPEQNISSKVNAHKIIGLDICDLEDINSLYDSLYINIVKFIIK